MSEQLEELQNSYIYYVLQNANARHNFLQSSELAYVKSRLNYYNKLTSIESADELLLTLVVDGEKPTFRIADFLLLCMYTQYSESFLKAIVDLVKDHDDYDDVFTNMRFIKFMFALRSYMMVHNAPKVNNINVILAYIYRKFPDMYNMNFNFRKFKGERHQIFSPMMSKIFISKFESNL